ncbi:MAG: sulfurtransferase TusA family protein [Gammaproteobacteria bacterium]|jgi:tRNA 2-thiouridine synthesizing protein A|nr:sulfurtransferase TusA family protein [Gammaproteobacteria bacterium]MDH3888418.1 sulfurtransferase TusA family protein [Gammaproteobacteria bacterium]MDH3984995.1 sulfurtransferase TusA family protein [Gammaproteobacteria bacterium]
MSTTVVDARNLLCPMPVIRAQDAVVKLQPGDTVQVLCTDPGVVHDIPAWCRIHGHEIFKIDEQGHEIVIHICVGTGN